MFLNNKNLNLNDILNIDLLKDLQNILSNITNFTYSAIDFRGNPINDYYNCCEFCKKMLDTPKGRILCHASRVNGALQASSTQKPYIFICHAGLLEAIFPIIVDDNYVGAITFGKVRTNNDKIPHMKNLNCNFKTWVKDTTFLKDFWNTPYIDYNKIEDVVSLINIILNKSIRKSKIDSNDKSCEERHEKGNI